MKETHKKGYYLGNLYPIVVRVDACTIKNSIEFDGDQFIVKTSPEADFDLELLLKQFYIRALNKLLDKRLKHYQALMKVKYKCFSIETHPQRWGSCSSTKQLTFHWQLAMFQLKAIDYVIVHELCHTVHLNHDRSFWRLVGKYCPDYKQIMPMLGTEKTRT
ncbi:M48 family metallopeptidase [Fusibacter sp. 3D3]|uniref:M48 family metallopeptidase n=1 Tax=Fusibacter sp. 3D3 TaxID=1048380 RepID=UPI000852C243|nr:SprT family zinc-dependent metalloprotease [Fusibacter sp. 3D3]GAU79931.1 putative predicted metal-dependent hydrolase [Fusibacter sp. 3D3]